MVLLRKIVFYVFAIIFLAGAPVIVLYALGYLFSPGEEGVIVKTGLVSVSTLPTEAGIYLDGKKHSEKTPALIRNLVPGRYRLALHREGYRTWQKFITIEPGKAAQFHKILLIPEKIEPEILIPVRFKDLRHIPRTSRLLLARDGTVGGLIIYDFEKDEAGVLFEGADIMSEAVVKDIHVRPKSPYVLIEAEKEGRRKYLWINAGDGDHGLYKDLTPFLAEEERANVIWGPGNGDYLYLAGREKIRILDLKKPRMRELKTGGTKGFGFYDNHAYILRPDTLERMDLDGGGRRQVFKDPGLLNSLFEGKGFFEIRGFDTDLFFFVSDSGKLIGSRLPYVFAEQGVQGLAFHKDTDKVLIWKAGSIGVLEFFSKKRKDQVFERKPRLQWILQSGRSIVKAFWLYHGNHILFEDGDRVYFLDFKTTGRPDIQYLFDVKEDTKIHYSEEEGEIYFLDSRSGYLSAAGILPKRQIPFLNLPDDEPSQNRVPGT